MPRKVAVAVDNDFRGGLITEATGLKFPENACTETINCIHDEKGRTTRRLGFDFETNYDTLSDNRESTVVCGYTWNNVAGDGSVSIRVQQIDDTLRFYLVTESTVLSSQVLASTIDLNTYVASTDVDPGLNECQFSGASGYLIVVHPQLEPFYCTYNPETEIITGTEITINIRDFEGVEDTLAIDNRPTYADAAALLVGNKEHYYNLFNQGWYFNTNAALTAWAAARTDVPSNVDVWWLFKNTNDAFDATTVANVFTGNAPAPKGHYLLNVFSQDRATASGVAGIPIVDTDDARVSTTGFYAGRVFYAGLDAQGNSGKVFFSPIIENASQFGDCYQANDPTSEDLSDLLPSDGGVIHIFGVESIVKLFPLDNALLVFATNGVWAIAGSEGVGFRATDYTVNKISSVSALNYSSFIDLEGFPVWWNMEGIYRLAAGQNGLEVQSLSDTTIRSFYREIPVRGRKLARGAYNPIEKLVRWVFKSTESNTPDEDYEFDSALTFNTITGTFYPWEIATGNVYMHDCFVIKGEGGVQSLESVLDEDGFEIQDGTGDVVTTFSMSRFLIAPQFKYFVSSGEPDVAEFTFSDNDSATYMDWFQYDAIGQDYDSTFTVGYKVHSDTQRHFQANYVFVFLEQEEGAGCSMRGLWEFTSSVLSGRWSNPQQIYNSTLQYRSVNFRRLKVRGKGRALQLQFNSQTGSPFTIIGWSIFETQNAGL